MKKFVIGSAVKITSEVSIVTGITVTLNKILDPNGDTVASGVSMAFDDSSNTKNASTIWQSTKNTHITGWYKYFVKATNGTNTDIAEGRFFLGDDT